MIVVDESSVFYAVKTVFNFIPKKGLLWKSLKTDALSYMYSKVSFEWDLKFWGTIE